LPDEARKPILDGLAGSSEKLSEVAGQGAVTVKTGFKKAAGLYKQPANQNTQNKRPPQNDPDQGTEHNLHN